MANYVDSGTQTIIAGLTKHPSARPPPLDPSPRPDIDTTTPPDEMATEKLQLPSGIPAFTSPHARDRGIVPSSLFSRRKNRPQLVARISLPAPDLDTEIPKSPPPTEAVLSPLPAANKLHAGHTPIIPRARSPLMADVDTSGPPTPQQDEALSGPLTLPANPGDGAEDRIELKALDNVLEKIAREQEAAIQDEKPKPIQHPRAEDDLPRTRETSPRKPRRPSADEVETVDGVLLKKPMMNLGAPLGQA